MKDQLITFETAKLAKEKGFDELTHFFWLINPNRINYFKIASNQKDRLLAPTQSLLQKWLREKYNIHIIIIPHNNIKLDFTISVLQLGNKIMVGFEENGSFNTYEQALEEALQEALQEVLGLIN